ncbi:MAG TPA: hypothetical protein VLC09_19375 [Polyangiaceae bacterium]|nr:hypothetical protein [Polyangiaceae bacterium]
MPEWDELLERAEAGLGSLSAEARGDANAALELCRAVARGEAPEDAPRQLLGLVEVLSRRTARAIPFATLGRAALAELRNSPGEAAQLRADTSKNLAIFGL